MMETKKWARHKVNSDKNFNSLEVSKLDIRSHAYIVLEMTLKRI